MSSGLLSDIFPPLPLPPYQVIKFIFWRVVDVICIALGIGTLGMLVRLPHLFFLLGKLDRSEWEDGDWRG